MSGAPNLTLLLRSYLTQMGVIESVAFDVLNARDPASAANAQLDGLSALIGLVREEGDSDARLRIRFDAQKGINRSQATLEEVYSVITTLAPGVAFKATNYGDASFTIDALSVIDPTIANQAVRAILRMKAAGVYGFVSWWTEEPVFGFFEDTGSSVLGFGSGGLAFSASG